MEIRPLRADDATAAAALSGQFGYPVAADVMRERIERLAQTPGQALFGADDGGRLAGWIHLREEESLEAGLAPVISGLVVDESRRSEGIGALLLRAGEEWARSRGHHRLRVRSNVERERALRFYLREGYREKKTSRVLEKKLD
jgi:GNAT superfamily N-acetyltransferase